MRLFSRQQQEQSTAVYVLGEGPAAFASPTESTVVYPDGSVGAVSPDAIAFRGQANSVAHPATAPRQSMQRLEFLATRYGDAGRSGSMSSSTFSLVATMVGGGALSLPFAMSKFGLAGGFIALVVSAVVSAWTYDMLIASARCTGADSFESLAQASLGQSGKLFSVILVFVVTWLVLVAYTVLVGDMLLPIYEFFNFGYLMSSPAYTKAILMVASGVSIFPMCCQHSLANMRFLCFISVFSVLLVACILTWKSVQSFGIEHAVYWQTPTGNTAENLYLTDLKWWPRSVQDAIYAFPMFALSFVCHFNVLPIHEELTSPSRFRIRTVMNVSTGLAAVVYTVLGIFGFMFAGVHTCGNILLNFSKNDYSVIVARAIFACVLMLNLPLMVLPCRSSLLRALHMCIPARRVEILGEPLVDRQADVDGQSSVDASFARQSSPGKKVYVYLAEDHLSKRGRLQSLDSFVPKSATGAAHGTGDHSEPSTGTRVAVSALLLGTAVATACTLSSVLTIWAIFGSTACFMLAWFLPCIFWLRLIGPISKSYRRVLAKVFLGITCLLMVVCTANTILNLGVPACPVVS